MRMRVADYIVDRLYQAGAEHAFLITGGMIMTLTDALLVHGKQQYVCCHHEQAAAMAADAYGRYTNKLGVAYVTAGPAALNTLTGVVGAYVDRSPCIVVAGQSKVSQATVTEPRQFALQGFNTLPIFEQVTKYAVMLDRVDKVKYEVEKCIHIAMSHPVGPVWIECPIDIQAASFDPDDYPGFTPEPSVPDDAVLDALVDQVAEALRSSRRPFLLLGAGVRLAGAVDAARDFATATNIPVLTSRLGMDLLEYDHPLYVGHPGTYGDRPANFTVQNADLMINIGCRLGVGLVGYDYQDFAPHAKKVIVDVDPEELRKPSIVPDIPVLADAACFLERLTRKLAGFKHQNQAWVDQTQSWKRNYPVDLPEYLKEKEGINSYHFMTAFSEKMEEGDLFLLDTGSCFHVHAQAFRMKRGQRHIITGGLSTMGYMPGAIGVAAASAGRDVYCVTGDGSLQMNLQELQTIVHNKFPVKLMVLNNNGYLLIRHSQGNFMEGRLIGESPATGVSFPDLKKIAKAYGISYVKISRLSELSAKLDQVKELTGPVICEIITPSKQLLVPRVASKKLDDGTMVSMPYDDMFPFLPRDEYQKNRVFDKL
ncbi:acetolactate synthase [Geomonas limicola]|uniref:Acetolactate synthase n=1 Tax=Geomonas limicola TaxID=2740186 RepID=A0A6V8NBY6_9BACT|nr:thiamine pyrophosphate-binding protein [Geomonas limicola]GFO70135.1 acetolactate synthase [Geomonas limicola]